MLIFTFMKLRVFFGCLVTLLRYKSLEYMTAADVIVISSTTPIFVEIMAHAFLGEEFGIYHVLATFLTLLGVTIVARPPFLLGTPQVDSSFLVVAIFCIISYLNTTEVNQ